MRGCDRPADSVGEDDRVASPSVATFPPGSRLSDPPLAVADEESASLLRRSSRWIAAWRAAVRQIAHGGEAAGLVAVMAVFACLPVGVASALGGFLGRGIGPRLRASRVARRNLSRALPTNSAAENERILRAMWDNLGRAVAENPHLRRVCAAGSGRVEVVNGDAIAALLASGRPSLLFGGHFANWEVGPTTVHLARAEELLKGAVHEFAEAMVGEGEPAVLVLAADGAWQAFHQGMVERLRLPQRLLGLSAL